jgi:hypothetical protein
MTGESEVVLESARKKCWAARDAYFACADASSFCFLSRRAFTSACPSAWVRHFDKKRADSARVAALLELQANPVPKQRSEAD